MGAADTLREAMSACTWVGGEAEPLGHAWPTASNVAWSGAMGGWMGLTLSLDRQVGVQRRCGGGRGGYAISNNRNVNPEELQISVLQPYLAHGGEGRHVRWFGGQYLEVNGDHVSSER